MKKTFKKLGYVGGDLTENNTMKRNYQNQDPRIIVARFNSQCHETGKSISKGQECLYYPNGRKVFSLDSEQHCEYLGWLQDINSLGCDY